MKTIRMVQLADDLLTAYDSGGRKRHPSGRAFSDRHVQTVGQMRDKGRWRMALWAARGFEAALAEWMEEGGSPIRLSDVLRPQHEAAKLHGEYMRWVRAGRPEPGQPGWTLRMRVHAANPPNETNHGWGGATDLVVGLLRHPAYDVSTMDGLDDALARWWTIAARHGGTPIIPEPEVHWSEAWHFDWLGPLSAVRTAYHAEGYTQGYRQTARVGCTLAGTFAAKEPRLLSMAQLQGRLALAWAESHDAETRPFVGLVDGLVGRKTRAAAESFDVDADAPMEAIEAMDEGPLAPFWCEWG